MTFSDPIVAPVVALFMGKLGIAETAIAFGNTTWVSIISFLIVCSVGALVSLVYEEYISQKSSGILK